MTRIAFSGGESITTGLTFPKALDSCILFVAALSMSYTAPVAPDLCSQMPKEIAAFFATHPELANGA